jgi:hypothetical protein
MIQSINKMIEIEESKDIFKFVNLIEIQKLLINYPQLYILFEFTCLHINSLLKTKKELNIVYRSIY